MWIYYHPFGECLIHELDLTLEMSSEREHRDWKIRQDRNFTINTHLWFVLTRCLYQSPKKILVSASCVFRLRDIPGHGERSCEHIETRCTISYFTRGNQMESWPLWRAGNTEEEEAVPLRNIINMSPGEETRDQNRRLLETAVVAFAWSRTKTLSHRRRPEKVKDNFLLYALFFYLTQVCQERRSDSKVTVTSARFNTSTGILQYETELCTPGCLATHKLWVI
jgi:hypothetical protein